MRGSFNGNNLFNTLIGDYVLCRQGCSCKDICISRRYIFHRDNHLGDVWNSLDCLKGISQPCWMRQWNEDWILKWINCYYCFHSILNRHSNAVLLCLLRKSTHSFLELEYSDLKHSLFIHSHRFRMLLHAVSHKWILFYPISSVFSLTMTNCRLSQ